MAPFIFITKLYYSPERVTSGEIRISSRRVAVRRSIVNRIEPSSTVSP